MWNYAQSIISIRNYSMAEITSLWPLAGARVTDVATAVTARYAGRVAGVLAELAAATPKGTKTA